MAIGVTRTACRVDVAVGLGVELALGDGVGEPPPLGAGLVGAVGVGDDAGDDGGAAEEGGADDGGGDDGGAPTWAGGGKFFAGMCTSAAFMNAAHILAGSVPP